MFNNFNQGMDTTTYLRKKTHQMLVNRNNAMFCLVTLISWSHVGEDGLSTGNDNPPGTDHNSK